jgi:DNA-binding CsgD family transcriptional regulator
MDPPLGSSILSIPRSIAAPSYVVRLRKRTRWLLLQIATGAASSAAIEPALQGAFGLTVQAARLVARLLDGDDLAACAAKLGVSRNTAKFHLRIAFEATQTSRQADLVQRAATVLRDLGF